MPDDSPSYLQTAVDELGMVLDNFDLTETDTIDRNAMDEAAVEVSPPRTQRDLYRAMAMNVDEDPAGRDQNVSVHV
jgi:hypothetical protein